MEGIHKLGNRVFHQGNSC